MTNLERGGRGSLACQCLPAACVYVIAVSACRALWLLCTWGHVQVCMHLGTHWSHETGSWAQVGVHVFGVGG
jgi:hypothetical protein